MAEIIQFPTSRIVRRPEQIVPKFSEKRDKEIQIAQFIEDLTEQLSMTILAICQENVVNMKSD